MASASATTGQYVGETHSEFFRRSLDAWRRRAPAGWDVDQRLEADCRQPLTIERMTGWYRELLDPSGAPAAPTGATAPTRATAPTGATEATEAAKAASSEQVGVALRRMRNWLMLCLIERDLSGRAALSEVCESMSWFAAFSSQAAIRVLAREKAELQGIPFDELGMPQDLLIIAMGKAGGGELNVSSDLDVVFVVRGDGETRRGEPGQPGSDARGGRSSAEFFHQLARQWVALMSNNDEHGFVFRVDTRLRPDGDSGPLVATFAMLEHYFFGQAREWERFAWLKSKCVADSGLAGDERSRHDVEALEAMVRPFVFRRYHDFNAFNALRDLHGKIRSEVGKKDFRREGSYDVKLGRGGIREIEFAAQLFQIVRGGRDPELRSPNTLSTLASLARKKHIDEADATDLSQAYEFLRRTEHALQYREDAQTHRLALAPEPRAQIAAMLRLDPAEFEAQLLTHTSAVQRVFDLLLRDVSDDASPGPAGAASDALTGQSSSSPSPSPSSPPGPGVTATRQAGAATGAATDAVTDAATGAIDEELAERLAALRASGRFLSAKAETQAVVAQLIARAQSAGATSTGLLRLLTFIETVIGRPAYLALLARYPKAFARVLDMISKAKWASDYLNRHPIVLDELLDGEFLERVDYKAWRLALASQLGQAVHDGQPDIERQMDLMREAHHAQEFRLLAQDIAGLLTVERLSDFLSELADQVLELALQLIWSQLPGRFRDTPKFAIIAYGKLGGKELGYASDLDLVFLYDDDDERALEIYSRLGQKLSGWLSLRTAAGILFEIDLRLRPNGNAGLLVTSVQSFQDYQRDSAWVWEHQALTRARFAAGDPAIGERFEAIRQAVIAQPRDPSTLTREVLEMRQKMLDGHPNRSPLFDLKHDRGGMVDIEFIVQYLVLAHSHRFEDLRVDAGNIALLNRAGAHGLIDAALAARVADSYRSYRQQQHLLRLNGADHSRLPHESVSESRQAVLQLWRETLEA